MILCIETSSHFCSVALADLSGEVIASLEVSEPLAHGRVLVPLIQKLIDNEGVDQAHWKAVALSAGPGSYTGLRIGSAVAKGIAMVHNIPLIPISTLKLLYLDMRNTVPSNTVNIPNNCLWVPMIDARRMEVYTAVYNTDSETHTKPQAHIASPQTASALWQNNPVILGGSGAQKMAHYLKPFLTNPDSVLSVLPNATPKALNMSSIAASYFKMKRWVDAIQFEPQYLKPFYTQAQPIQHEIT